MSYVQIVTLTTDHADELLAVDDQWRADTAGRNTVVKETLYTDANTPNRYVAVVEFASRADAERNSALPETAATAARFAELSSELGYLDLELVKVTSDRRAELVAGMLEFIATATIPDGIFTGDVACDLNVPFGRVVTTGPDALAMLLAQGTPAGSVLEGRRWTPTEDGFVLEFQSRSVATPGRPSTYSRQIAWVTVADRRIARLAVYCTGDWDPATEARNAVQA